MTEIVRTTPHDLQQQQPIQDLLQGFIDYIDVKEVTVKSYTVCLRCFADWLQANNITQPTRTDILNYKTYLVNLHP